MKTKLVYSLAGFVLLLIGCSKDASSPTTPTPPTITTITLSTVTTSSVSNIAEDTAVAAGTITLNGDTALILESGICFAIKSNPSITDSKIVSAAKDGSFSCILTNLNSNTTYYVRAFIKKYSGIVYGNEVSFISAKRPTNFGNHYFNGPIYTLCTDALGNVYAGGGFYHTGNGSDWTYIAKWNGSTWAEMTGLKSDAFIISSTTDKQGNLYAGVRRYGTSVEYYIAKWDGTNWSNAGDYNNSNYFIRQVHTDLSGNIYAIGRMQNANQKYYVAKWGQTGYSELGAFKDFPKSICTDAVGNLYAAGLMNNGNGQNHFYVAKWDGSTWSQLGDFNDVISSVAINSNGNLLAAGAFYNANAKEYVAQWNGTGWSELGSPFIPYNYAPTNEISQMCCDQQGNVYICGGFKNAAGKYYIAKWDGSTWSEVASFDKAIYSICVDARGNLYAAGNFTASNGLWYVAKCN